MYHDTNSNGQVSKSYDPDWAVPPRRSDSSFKKFSKSITPRRWYGIIADYWMIWLLLIGSIVAVGLLLILPGCKAAGVFNPSSWFSTDIPKSPKGNCASGEQSTYATLRQMSWAFLLPGIGLAIASYWLPFFKKLAAWFIGIGACAAITPWLLDFARPVLWVGVGLGAAYIAFWLVLRGRKLWRERNRP